MTEVLVWGMSPERISDLEASLLGYRFCVKCEVWAVLNPETGGLVHQCRALLSLGTHHHWDRSEPPEEPCGCPSPASGIRGRPLAATRASVPGPEGAGLRCLRRPASVERCPYCIPRDHTSMSSSPLTCTLQVGCTANTSGTSYIGGNQ